MSAQCTNRVVGDILSSWRYDISGLAPEMRVDYEAHLAECNRCHTRQRIHRAIDIGLILIATVSAGLFALAFGAIWKLEPRHTMILEIIALTVAGGGAGHARSGSDGRRRHAGRRHGARPLAGRHPRAHS